MTNQSLLLNPYSYSNLYWLA